MIINLFDNAFRHLPNSVHGKISKSIEFVRDKEEWDGVTLFTDDYISTPAASLVTCPHKIGWILECRTLIPQVYDNLSNFINQYDFVLTHDKQLLEEFPDKTKKVIFGGCWVEEESYKIYPKSKNLSMIYSPKKFMPGHKLRHIIAESNIEGLDLFGRGSSTPIEKKEEALVDYKYSIVIENDKRENYFTEKLLDCFATGTIPVYYGCPNIGDYFDKQGIIEVHSKEHFLQILPTLTEELYQDKLSSIYSNFYKFGEYAITEDWLHANILKEYDK
jgi:hypothetical protein